MGSPFVTEEPGTTARFEVWVRGIRVASSDYECFTTVYVDGEEVFNLAASLEYTPEEERQWGEAPQAVGFSAAAAAQTLDGKNKHDLGARKWKLLRDSEVPTDEVSKRERPKS